MLSILRKGFLSLFIVVAGLLMGILIRFGFGRSLRWSEPASKTPASVAVLASGSAAAVSPSGKKLAPVSTENEALTRLKAIAGRDYTTLERLLAEAFDREMDGWYARDTGILIAQMMDIDAGRTLAWARKNVFGSSIEWNFFQVWRDKSPAAAEAWAAVHAPVMLERAKRYHTNIPKEKLAEMLRDNPAEVAALLTRPGRQHGGLLLDVASVRAGQDPAGAFTWARNLTNTTDRGEALERVLHTWSKSDPAAAAQAWQTLPKGQKASALLHDITAAMPKENALQWLRTLPPSPLIQSETALLLPEGEERRALIASLPASQKEYFHEAATRDMQAILEKGPSPAAFAALESACRDGATANWAVGKLYAADPAGTLAALTALPDGAFKSQAAREVAEHVAKMPESEARSLVASLPEGPFRDATAEKLALALGKTSPQDALEFLASQSTAARIAALPEVLHLILSQNAAEGRKVWDALPEAERAATAGELAQEIAWHPSAETMALLSTMPDIPAATVSEAVQGWVGQSPEQASEWVNTLPQGPRRDAAVNGMVDLLVTREWDPSRALTWATTITNERQRLTSLRTTLEIWSLREPDAAIAAWESLSPVDQQALSLP